MDVDVSGDAGGDAAEASSKQNAVPALQIAQVRVSRILVAVDFSETSRRALEYAVALARKLDAEIVLAHVFEGVPGELKILEASFVDTSLLEEARQSLSDWQGQLNAMGGFGVQSMFRQGAAVDRHIVEAARECKADLIVIGRHRRESFFLENIVRKVLRHAPCAVLVGP